ncbi:Hypothetical predicted protein [Pelobates cultripes]|uniref:Uncharacterized protein n=1 Tax=Pelobates cultripes TaxID=61616 RepID=A0AAD1RF53_PELCU|nr:Hypothetical predicted protein [Pelobates cultripes]
MVASWVRPTTRRRHYRYPLQAFTVTTRPGRGQNPPRGKATSYHPSAYTRPCTSCNRANEYPPQPNRLLKRRDPDQKGTNLRPEGMADHRNVDQKEACRTSTEAGFKPRGPTDKIYANGT